MQFYVIGVFKFFVDNFVYFGIGIDQCCCDDSQVIVFFYVMCCVEEMFWMMQGVSVYIIGQYFIGSWYYGVVGMCQMGDGVEQDDNVFFVFNQMFCFFDNYFGNLNVVGCWFVKGRCNYFVFYQMLYFGYFFWMFVNQQYYQYVVWVVICDVLCDVLQQYGFICFWWCDNQIVLVVIDW